MTRNADLLGLEVLQAVLKVLLQDFCQDFLLARIEGDCLMLVVSGT